jgi:hypothetical protein
MPGLIEVPRSVPLRSAIEDLLLIVQCGRLEDFADTVLFLPL